MLTYEALKTADETNGIIYKHGNVQIWRFTLAQAAVLLVRRHPLNPTVPNVFNCPASCSS
jgi:hypothetical protein